jgi:hypothetical protein
MISKILPFTISTSPLSVQALQSRSCLSYLVIIVTLTVVSLTTAKFKPLIFSVSGFALSYAANMFVLMILYDLCFVACTVLLYNHTHTEG